MLKSYKLRKSIFILSIVLGVSQLCTNCKKFISVDAPPTNVTGANVYTTDATACAVINGMYGLLSEQNADPYFGNALPNINFAMGLYTDELSLYNFNNTKYLNYYRNTLTPLGVNDQDFWSSIYSLIYKANSAIEGLEGSQTLTPSIKTRLLAEARFLRAFFYFYLVNLYGDVPLVLTTAYNTNSNIPRTDVSAVYDQIVDDLKFAKANMAPEFLGGDATTATTERTRPNKGAATALLARVYLYKEDWANAEIESSELINNSAMYDTVPLADVFLKNNKEAIWQWQPIVPETNTGEGKMFVLSLTGINVIHCLYLSTAFVNSIDPNDKRRAEWIGNYVDNTTGTPIDYPFPYKYKIGDQSALTQEYSAVFRLAEQYLIRAEARAEQNDFSGASLDLNVTRRRAGLSDLSINDKQSLVDSILQERRIEFFTEWAHRFFDLKRKNKIDAVMNVEAINKGGTWASYKSLLPISFVELTRNPSITDNQNPGYQ